MPYRSLPVPLFILLLMIFAAGQVAVAQGVMPTAGDTLVTPLQTLISATGGQAVYLPAIAKPGISVSYTHLTLPTILRV